MTPQDSHRNLVVTPHKFGMAGRLRILEELEDHGGSDEAPGSRQGDSLLSRPSNGAVGGNDALIVRWSAYLVLCTRTSPWIGCAQPAASSGCTYCQRSSGDLCPGQQRRQPKRPDCPKTAQSRAPCTMECTWLWRQAQAETDISLDPPVCPKTVQAGVPRTMKIRGSFQLCSTYAPNR